jgi:acyl-CoA synthetase (AMP-forming)/AMP-acid ligase II/alkylation response protein AidB-like acyl-CoA dehydrogenase/acyl carrier protein
MIVEQRTVSSPVTSLIDMLRRQALAQPNALSGVYLAEDESVKDQVTFGRLDEQARAIAARLQGLGVTSDPVMLLYPPGLEFISAFFGCLYAGVVAVPLPVPRHKAALAQFVGIRGDLDARIVLTTAATKGRLLRLDVPGADALTYLTTDDTMSDLARAWREPAVPAEAVAYLQYTSGSTSNRKGVAIRHGNVIANLDAIAERFEHHAASVGVNWLPHTHDLGLVSGILQPIYHGHLNVLMSPTAFVQHPVRWLNAITRYRGTYSNSPNFGYDLCVRQITPDQRATLDLGSWQVALNGAEPVRQQTMDAFAEAFAGCGLRPDVMFPAYGLAEATLMVSGGGSRRARPVGVSLEAAALERDRIVEASAPGKARRVMGCGRIVQSTVVVIVDPVTRQPCSDDTVGEIWVNGPGVAAGYWQREADTNDTFGARLAVDDGRTYLRTGDLGFLRDGELFITGRLKDLIIVRGSNHYPQDIELTIEQSHASLRPGCGAAFSIEVDGTEQLVVVFELEREHLRAPDTDEVTRCARRAVAEQHDLQLYGLALLKTGTVPRTPSGKIQRRQCRADFLAGELSEVWRWTVEAHVEGRVEDPSPRVPVDGGGRARSAEELNAWLREYAGDRLNSRLMDERRSIAPHVLLDFGNEGVLGLQVPRAMGGIELGHLGAMQVFQQLGAIDETLAMMTIVHNVLGIRPILHHASPGIRNTWLPRLATGRDLAAFAITEPAAGSNPQGITSTAVPDGPDAWILNGQKSWSGTAGWASLINVFVQNRHADGSSQGVCGFAVPRATRGLRMGPEALTLGMRGMVQNTIYLEGARVTREQSLGEVGNGMAVAYDAMLQGRLAIGAACVGGMKRCLQLGLRYATRRTISTGRLVDNPVFLERAGTYSAALQAIESLVAQVAGRLDRGVDIPNDLLVMCKIAGSEWLCRAADDLVQFLGGRGYIETNVAAQLLRDARVTRILEGPTEALVMYLGSRVVNDRSALHRFLDADLGAASIAARLAEVADEVHARCTGTAPRFGDGAPDARRFAYALIGQVATDAVLAAVMPADAPAHCRVWAQQHFEASVDAAMERSSQSGFTLDAGALGAVVDSYETAIGDIEQTLAGEDTLLDAMLARGPARSTAVRPPAIGTAEKTRTTPEAQEVAGLRVTTGTVPDTPPEIATAVAVQVVTARAPRVSDTAEIEAFIARWVAKELKMPAASIDVRKSFFDYGLDSVTTVMLTAALEGWLSLEISPELAYDVPVMRQFAERLAQMARTR